MHYSSARSPWSPQRCYPQLGLARPPHANDRRGKPPLEPLLLPARHKPSGDVTSAHSSSLPTTMPPTSQPTYIREASTWDATSAPYCARLSGHCGPRSRATSPRPADRHGTLTGAQCSLAAQVTRASQRFTRGRRLFVRAQHLVSLRLRVAGHRLHKPSHDVHVTAATRHNERCTSLLETHQREAPCSRAVHTTSLARDHRALLRSSFGLLLTLVNHSTTSKWPAEQAASRAVSPRCSTNRSSWASND
jgi:hypothetical protein